MTGPIVLSASDVSLALSDPFGLWHDHHGDPRLKDPEDEYALFLKEQGLRIEKELLLKRHEQFTDLKGLSFEAAVTQTKQLLKYGHVVIYGGAVESNALGLRARPDVIGVERGRCIIEEYKLAGTPDETHEIQALVYAYLLKKGYGMECESQVVSRLNETFPIPFSGGDHFIATKINVTGRVSCPPGGIMSDHYAFLHHVTGETAKITIPAPSMLRNLFVESTAISREIYPDPEEFWVELGQSYHDVLMGLAAIGCRYLQLDDVNTCLLCSDELRALNRAAGRDPDALLEQFIVDIEQLMPPDSWLP